MAALMRKRAGFLIGDIAGRNQLSDLFPRLFPAPIEDHPT